MSLFVLPPTQFKLAAQRVCMCVCVCVGEREKEKERREKHHPVTMVKGEKKEHSPGSINHFALSVLCTATA